MFVVSFTSFERKCMLGLLSLRLALQVIRFIVVLFEAIDMVKRHHTALGDKGGYIDALQHGYGTFHDQKVDNDVMNLAIGISKTIKKQNDQYEQETHDLLRNSLFNLVTRNTKYNSNQLFNISANHMNNQYKEYQHEETEKMVNNMATNISSFIKNSMDVNQNNEARNKNENQNAKDLNQGGSYNTFGGGNNNLNSNKNKQNNGNENDILL